MSTSEEAAQKRFAEQDKNWTGPKFIGLGVGDARDLPLAHLPDVDDDGLLAPERPLRESASRASAASSNGRVTPPTV